jgi:hypothetical protein
MRISRKATACVQHTERFNRSPGVGRTLDTVHIANHQQRSFDGAIDPLLPVALETSGRSRPSLNGYERLLTGTTQRPEAAVRSMTPFKRFTAM